MGSGADIFKSTLVQILDVYLSIMGEEEVQELLCPQ